MFIRDRAWRRHIEDTKVIKRTKRLADKCYWWSFEDVNQVRVKNPIWIDFIGTKASYFFKNSTTDKYDTRYKIKWGKKGKKHYDWSCNYWTRPKDKNRYKKELNEFGLKHIPTKL